MPTHTSSNGCTRIGTRLWPRFGCGLPVSYASIIKHNMTPPSTCLPPLIYRPYQIPNTPCSYQYQHNDSYAYELSIPGTNGANGVATSGSFFFRFAQPIYYLRTFSFSFSLPSRISGPGHDKALLPLPHYGTSLNFYRGNNSARFSLFDSRRLVLTHAKKRSRQLTSL